MTFQMSLEKYTSINMNKLCTVVLVYVIPFQKAGAIGESLKTEGDMACQSRAIGQKSRTFLHYFSL
jgi:hypothetical protein